MLPSPNDASHPATLLRNRGSLCAYEGEVGVPRFCPSEKKDVEESVPQIIVNQADLLLVLTRLYRLRLQNQEEEDEEISTGNRLFQCYQQSLMRREEFKTAIELFGYRDEDVAEDFTESSISALKFSCQGKICSHFRRERRC